MEEADREALYAIASDPMVWEQHPIHDRWRRDVFDVFFDEGLACGGGLVAERKEGQQIVGSTRYGRFVPEDQGCVEIGWSYLSRNCWGKGINAEMKRAMLAHAFNHVVQVHFRVGDTNYRSRNALEAIGAVRTDHYELERYQGRRVVHLTYAIDRGCFAAGQMAR